MWGVDQLPVDTPLVRLGACDGDLGGTRPRAAVGVERRDLGRVATERGIIVRMSRVTSARSQPSASECAWCGSHRPHAKLAPPQSCSASG